MTRQIFVNLPVADVSRSRAFFAGLGFSFNEQFSDASAACMVVSDTISVQLLATEKFQTFTPKPVFDARKGTETLLCLSCESRAEVDQMVRKAVAGGGSTFQEPVDHGFMYHHAFQDLDGHLWELIHWAGNA